jgi:acetyl-CoA carboxylase carboxyltransferase component
LSRSEAPPLRVYDIRNVIDVLADEGSVLEIRRDFGVGIVTTFIRIEGQPFGLIANNPNTSEVRSMRRREIRPRVSCSCASL